MPPEQASSPTVNPGIRFSEFQLRLMSSLLLLPVVLTIIYAGGIWFTGLMIVAAILMIREWDNINLGRHVKWRVIGVAYVLLPTLSMVWLRNSTEEGFREAMFLFVAIWACDIGAYLVGRTLKGPKMAPSISPGKTWSGLGGGMVSAALAGALMAGVAPYPDTPFSGAVMGALLALVGQCGDLFESWMKRRAGVKDSGRLIPGHGGLLDRVDSLIFTAPLFALYIFFSQP
jgi:phosphatidate cytidylyltransferase